LKIFPENTPEKLGFEFILEATLEKLHSDIGREIIAALRPSHDASLVDEALTKTGEAMRLLRIGDPLPLEEMADVRPALARARPEGSVLDTQSILDIGKLMILARRVHQYFAQRDDQYPAWRTFSSQITPLKSLEEEIFKVVSDHGGIKDSASPELQTIRRSLNARRNDLRTALNKILRQASKDGYLSEQEPTIRSGRMVLAIKAEHKRKISGFIHDSSATGQTVYLEPVEALHINNDIRQLENDEQREIERILKLVTSRIRESQQPIRYNAERLGELDAGFAIARMSIEINGVIPEISQPRSVGSQAEINLIKAYNPHLYLKAIRAGESAAIVPMDFRLEPNELCLVITGPNAGGKSVALKTIGLHAIMIQSGFAVPLAEGSSIPVFGSLFVDMGDEQSIENDLSTFSSRLTWMRATEVSARWDSLVLIDEAGTGTDPEEGVALYQSLLETLLERRSISVVTTHHGNLKVFAHNHPMVVNASMEFDQKNLSPTYKFQKGLPGSSYAFEIAQRMGVSDELLARARSLIGDSRNKLEMLISSLESKAQQAEEMRSTMEIQLKESKKLMTEYQEKYDSMLRERDKIREKALIEARNIMQGANKRIEEAVRLIQEGKAGKKEIKEIRKEVDSTQKEILNELAELSTEPEPKTLGTPPVIGDAVKMIDGNTIGELVEIDGKQAVVLTSGLRLKTKYKNLVKVEKLKKKNLSRVVIVNSADDDGGSVVRSVSSSIDLRGKRGEEAVSELTYYLDRAISSGLNQVEVIHGKGDGILRKLVHNYLRDRKEVGEFALAPWEQGGPGCTIVHLN
jgi:DNA mismatch repair protein MutS2